jgi:hypothetical protein
MPTQTYSKRIKRLLREYNAQLYEAELHQALALLDMDFSAWRSGEITSAELNRRIHAYETGTARDLYKQYDQGLADINVAHAVVVGLLDEDQMSAELLEALSRQLAFFRSLQEQGELKEPGEQARRAEEGQPK